MLDPMPEASMTRRERSESFLDRATRLRPGMSKGQRRIADLLVREGHGSAFFTASDVAGRADVSESTVVRFAQFLGYEGYLEMRQALAAEAQQGMAKQARFLEAPTRAASALVEVARTSQDNIQRMLSQVDESLLDEVMQLFMQSRTRVLIGRGISHHMAGLLGYLLFLVGIPNVAGHASDLSLQVAALDREDLLVAFSFHPYSLETLDAAAFAKKRGVPVLAFTDREDAPLAKLADRTLLVPGENLIYSHSTVAFGVLASALVAAIGAQDSEGSLKRVREAEAVSRPGFHTKGL